MNSATLSVRIPAWREPMVWLVWGLPTLVVVAGFVTLFLAIRAGGADAIPWSVRRTAQIQVEDLRADAQAQALGLAGELALASDTGALSLRLQGTAAPGLTPQLRLTLSHPLDASADQHILLSRSGEVWVGRLPVGASAGHAWNVQVEALNGDWRLRGRLEVGQGARLLPMSGY